MSTLTRIAPLALLFTSALVGCQEGPEDFEESAVKAPEFGGDNVHYCAPAMEHFPVAAAHNIGYDHASCGSGTCDISCPDANANSDWGGAHHGIDVFAYQRAPLVAVAAGEIVAVGTPSSTSGLRVRLKDVCGWEYYYGHMDEAVVSVGQTVNPGDLLGYMGYTGTASTHLHFNVSDGGNYSSDIDPFELLDSTSPTACGGSSTGSSGSGSSGSGSSGSGSSGSGSSGSGSSGSGSSGSGSSGSGSSGSSGGSSSAGASKITGNPAYFGSCGWTTGTTYLMANDYVASCDGRFTFLMQGDGNLVLYKNGSSAALWHTNTHGNSGAYAMMQGDGNLVVYSAWHSPLWASWTQDYPGAVLWAQDNGDVVLWSGSTPVWGTNTGWY